MLERRLKNSESRNSASGSIIGTTTGRLVTWSGMLNHGAKDGTPICREYTDLPGMMSLLDGNHTHLIRQVYRWWNTSLYEREQPHKLDNKPYTLPPWVLLLQNHESSVRLQGINLVSTKVSHVTNAALLRFPFLYLLSTAFSKPTLNELD